MPFLLRNISLTPGEEEGALQERLSARFSLPAGEITGFRLRRKGIDARKKSRILLVYTVEFSLADEEGFWERHRSDPDLERVPQRESRSFPKVAAKKRVVIVGAGPAGLFAALRLAEYGITATLLERGGPVAERVAETAAFWRSGELNCESNVQFGEGGAGTFSDGKLTTRVRDDNCGYVLERLAGFGAPAEILYQAKPHIGTDRLRQVVVNIRGFLHSRGFDVRFRSRVSDIVAGKGAVEAVIVDDRLDEPCDFLLLAPGNSARDTYAMLERRGVRIERKPFAVGLRVEHPQGLVDRIQYGPSAHPSLPPADYALAWNDERSGRSAYSFCMCPGGVVVAAASEGGGVVTNGMSDHLRDSPFANSALVVTVGKDDFPGDSPLAGIDFQRSLERAAYAAGGGGYLAPAQSLMTFIGERGVPLSPCTYRPGVVEADLVEILPGFVADTLKKAIRVFDRKMRGFVTAEATLTGVETRTSAPVRIIRGEDLQSPSLRGLYPMGEGAGYAGGIMSSALDGIRTADAIAGSIACSRPKF